jgi:surfeit locus 1 family protein
MPIKFRFAWIPFFATLVAVGIGLSLGQWQTRRAVEKETIERTLLERESAPPVALNTVGPVGAALEYRRISVRGEFVRDWPIYLDNRPYRGEAGFYILMPLKMEGSDTHVLVARGWVKRNVADRAKLPPLATPAGTVEIQGVARSHPGKVLQLGNAEPLRPGAIVQNLEIRELAQAVKAPMQPFMIEQLTDIPDGLVRDWPRPSGGADKHRGYAFQWYALAATAFIFFVVTGLRRGRK